MVNLNWNQVVSLNWNWVVNITGISTTISFLFNEKNEVYLLDYQIVVRNLIQNTKDKSAREWPKMIPSTELLFSHNDVYEYLAKLSDPRKIIGFDNLQRDEEIFKAKLIVSYPEHKELIHKIENNPFIEGNISTFIYCAIANTTSVINNLKLTDIDYNQINFSILKNIYNAYCVISKNDFTDVWGDLINSELYYLTDYSRLDANANYKKHPEVILFAKRFSNVSSTVSLESYIESIQKKFIIDVDSKYISLEESRDVKEQLYIYYIINKRIYNGDFKSFFKNNNVNFGWLAKEPGYKSLFTKGIEGCQYFPNSNPIFQVYNQQFRYNLGINKNNTLNIEIIGIGNKKKPFDKIIDWAKKK